MRVPDKVKVGGLFYSVLETQNLKNGCDYSGEIDYVDLEIRLRPAARPRMEHCFFHELVHALHDFLGYTEHDEKKIDELAGALYALVVDNPELFTKGDE